MRNTNLLPLLALCVLSVQARAGRLIAVDSSRTMYELDQATGVKTMIGTVSSNVTTPSELTRDPATGTVYLCSTGNDSLFTLDIATGNATLIAQFSDTSVVMHGLEWDSSTSTLWGGSSGNLFTIDTTTAVVTQVGVSGLASFTNLGYVPATDSLYATNSGTDSFYSVNRTTGAMMLIGPLTGPTNPNGVSYDSDHGVMWMTDNNTDSLYTIDLVTGLATLIGAHGGGSNILCLLYLPDSTAGTPFCFGDGSGTACPCGNIGAAGNGCASSVNANGASLAGSGVPSIASDTFVLNGSGMSNGSALYFQGAIQAAGGAGAVFGDGLRCAAGATVRLGTKTNSAGSSHYPDAGDALISIKGVNAAGNVREYQCWYRNAGMFCTPSTFNLTNGLEVTWQP